MTKQPSTLVVVFGASGDLAKKKVYPSLFEIFRQGQLPPRTLVLGYARSKKTDASFRAQIRPFLAKQLPSKQPDASTSAKALDDFLSICFYRVGQYHIEEDLQRALGDMAARCDDGKAANRMFYMAIPPSRFGSVGRIVRSIGQSRAGWNRVVVEKPFGRDAQSYRKLSRELGSLFRENQLFRIDHYLGKPIVRSIPALRRENNILSSLWSRERVSRVLIDWSEDIGTQGRGGYFDGYGIIRDVAQNHLCQILSLIAMEEPAAAPGSGAGTNLFGSPDAVRDAKARALRKIAPIRLEDTVVGQYQGYTDDKGVPANSLTPTFALMKVRVRSQRWKGVPFFIRCGKALGSRKCEVVMSLRGGGEFRIRVQPRPAVSFRLCLESPGPSGGTGQCDAEAQLSKAFPLVKAPSAYARLLLDVFQGARECFVREDELKRAWSIFTPLLLRLEKERIKPIVYAFGSEGPAEAKTLLESASDEATSRL